jgi:hypothetical protein
VAHLQDGVSPQDLSAPPFIERGVIASWQWPSEPGLALTMQTSANCSFTLKPRIFFPPVRGFLCRFPHYAYHSAKRLQEALAAPVAAYLLVLLGYFSVEVKSGGVANYRRATSGLDLW